MATYWITFRIADKTVGGSTYEERYERLTGMVLANSSNYWEQTTSFYVFESDSAIGSLAAALKGEISSSDDLFLLRQVDKQSARICGQNEDKDIFTLMPYLRSV